MLLTSTKDLEGVHGGDDFLKRRTKRGEGTEMGLEQREHLALENLTVSVKSTFPQTINGMGSMQIGQGFANFVTSNVAL